MEIEPIKLRSNMVVDIVNGFIHFLFVLMLFLAEI